MIAPAFSFWISKPLFALLSTTVNVYRPALSVATGFPFVVSASLPATLTVAASLPRNGTTPEPTISLEVGFGVLLVVVVGVVVVVCAGPTGVAVVATNVLRIFGSRSS